MEKYQKKYLTFEEQLALLESRGLSVGNWDRAIAELKRIGYYRLSGYWYPFRIKSSDHREGVSTPSDKIKSGYSFEDMVAIYDFDRVLRTVLWEAIERVEVAVRVAVAYQMGTYGPFAFLDKQYLSPGCDSPSQHSPEVSQFDEFSNKMRIAVAESREDFAKHHRDRYDGKVPVWVAIELWDFGMLSRFYQLMRKDDRAAVSNEFGISKSSTLASWLQAINLLRNYCAHHSRLSRRHFVSAPAIPKTRHFPEFEHVSRLDDRNVHRLYPLMCALSFILQRTSPDKGWRSAVTGHFQGIDEINGLSLEDYGVPNGWLHESLWQVD